VREQQPSSDYIRVQKILSQAGVASRRAAEVLVREGRVSINGTVVTELGVRAHPVRDDVRVDGHRVRPVAEKIYIALHKPTGYVTTRRDPEKRRTVMDLVPSLSAYIFPVGRLDYDSEGLLLLTNDGDLAAKLTHPSHEVEREYEALVAGSPSAEAIEKLARGVPLDGKRTVPAKVRALGARPGRDETWLSITLREGRNRQVRRMCEAVGHPVRRLRRVRFGPLSLGRLARGKARALTAREVLDLRVAAGVSKPRPSSKTARADRG
jgi:pseudouridine synthase